MPKSDPAVESAPEQSGGFAKVQNPDEPDQLDANNTGRVGDAREYDNLSAPSAKSGTAPGEVAAETVYADLDGKVVSSADAGKDGFRGSVVVVKGDVINAAQSALLNA